MFCREYFSHYISEFTVDFKKCHMTSISGVKNEFIIFNVKNNNTVLDPKIHVIRHFLSENETVKISISVCFVGIY